MMPVLYRFTFTTPLGFVIGYLLAAGIVAYVTWNGWRTAVGPLDPKTGKFKEPTRQQRMERARWYALFGAALALFGLYYALPEAALPVLPFNLPFVGNRAKGEGIPLHTYGIFIGIGFLGAVAVSNWFADIEWTGERGKKIREQIMDLSFYVFAGGIGGSVLLFNIVNWEDGLAHGKPLMGMVFQGGLVCAAAAAFWYGKKNDIDFLRLSDIALPTVSLGSAFGRLGCFSAGCCWGKPSSGLAVKFPSSAAQDLFGGHSGNVASAAYASMSDCRTETRWVVEATGQLSEQAVAGSQRLCEWVQAHGSTIPIHPTQLYESAIQFCLFALFISLRPLRRFHGQIAGMWLMVYAIERAVVELFRGDGERGTIHGYVSFIPRDAWYNISTGQFLSICIFSLGAFVLIREWRKYLARPRPELAGQAQPA